MWGTVSFTVKLSYTEEIGSLIPEICASVGVVNATKGLGMGVASMQRIEYGLPIFKQIYTLCCSRFHK